MSPHAPLGSIEFSDGAQQAMSKATRLASIWSSTIETAMA
jgi:hypothetical protein